MRDARTVLITGASSGFGEAIARRLAGQGDRVIVAGRRLARLKALADDIGPGQAFPLALDLREADLATPLSTLPEEYTAIDVLVNNAGLALGLEAAPRARIADWEEMIATNCLGLVRLTRLLLPGMAHRRAGHVVNLGSVAGTYPYPGGNVYGATKAFVHQFCLNLRADLHGTGVRVTSIEPGMCGGTEFSIVRFGGDSEKAAAVYEGMQPLSADDVAAAVEWTLAQPAHVNVNRIELMPTAQSFGPLAVHRQRAETVG